MDDERRSSHPLVRAALAPPSAGAGRRFFVGVVVSPSTEGAQEFYTLDIYGEGVSTLSDPVTDAGVLARSTATTNYFYRGEVVLARRVDGEWLVYKFFQVNSEAIASGQLWLRPFCADSDGTFHDTNPITFDTTRSGAPPLCLQDALFDYAEVTALVTPSTTVLEVLGNYLGSYVVSADFLAANMVPVKPVVALAANVCTVISSYGSTPAGPALGAWIAEFYGSYVASDGYSASFGSSFLYANLGWVSLGRLYSTVVGGVLKTDAILAPSRVGDPAQDQLHTTSMLSPSGALATLTTPWDTFPLWTAVRASRPALVTTADSLSRDRIALVLAIHASDLGRWFRFVTPSLDFRGVLANANGGSSVTWS